MANSEIKLFSN